MATETTVLAIPPALLCYSLPLQRGLCFLRIREGDGARLSRAADSAPLAHHTPLPKQIRLHVNPVVAVHVSAGVDAVEDKGRHGDNLEMVLWLTLSREIEQFKAILAAEIIKAVDRDRLTVRAAHKRTGIAAADFSRVRNADLGRFAVDRLMTIIDLLGSRIEVKGFGG